MTESRTPDARIFLPAPPQAPTPFRFPLIAATVPVVASVAIWLITGSTFALIFAALGPLAATGSYIDSRVTARKTVRAERSRFAADAATTTKEIQAYHRRELVELAEKTPSSIMLVNDVLTDASKWMREPDNVLPVHLGYGSVRSSIAIDRTASHDSVSQDVEETYRSLTEQAEHLSRAPIAVNARLGIALFGNNLMALSLARSLAIQLARTLAPTSSWVRLTGVFATEIWGERLPHRLLRSSGAPGRVADAASASGEIASVQWGALGDPSPRVSITIVSEEKQVPSGHRIVIRTNAASVAVVRHPDRHQRRDFEPSFLGREQALVWVRAAHDIAARDGLASGQDALPDSFAFAELEKRPVSMLASRPDSRRSLAARPAVAASGELTIDLVVNGPHAIVGGTTGSGKSELLIAWVLAMAAEVSPEDVTFLLVDFKGGSAFTALTELPHTVGIITDLDETAAARAFSSLSAELRYRERALARAGVRDISELASVPRLVIVVDEFAAMMAEYPQLHVLFSDIAARGRSLGVHLILCTQRPSGVVRDALLANADLRISLRVNNGADSSAVIGSDRAAELPAEAKGRAWVAHGSSSAELVQFALVSPRDIHEVAERWPIAAPPRRPWCEPLSEHIPLASVLQATAEKEGRESPGEADTDTLHFGLTDLPELQRHGRAVWVPKTDGPLLLLGASGSGKTTALTSLAHVSTAAVVVMSAEPAAFWDTLAGLYGRLDYSAEAAHPSSPTHVVIDDIDAVLARFDDEYRAVVVERLTRVLREGPANGIWAIASAQRITSPLQSLSQLMPSILRLRFSSRQEFILSGGATDEYLPSLPSGGGLWRGKRVQVAQSGQYLPVAERSSSTTLSRSDHVVVASSRPSATATAYAAAGWEIRYVEGSPGSEQELLVRPAASRSPIALIGSVDEWQSRWGALAALRHHATIVLDGCSLSDYRQLARTRELPPPLTAGSGEYWCLTDTGPTQRVRLPHSAHSDGGAPPC
ncbi:FtsK/SpoIIIE domain-containing protein [Salinibacterium sp. SWN167]|uniref:FtsK/SpoIIIE domain-containing protein n=1 Tax=Salinibacterium sp. SWN167 TaxID=2792054 RepID=UPI0018CF29F9|nr:FtsK/SpoIIIE domain-containing protein [Salinibacterium sp. SWN167]MBH0084505.1 AAA family ATPase [Salinibacterium sp. SWN167]